LSGRWSCEVLLRRRRRWQQATRKWLVGYAENVEGELRQLQNRGLFVVVSAKSHQREYIAM
jgi:hypothetical protein